MSREFAWRIVCVGKYIMKRVNEYYMIDLIGRDFFFGDRARSIEMGNNAIGWMFIAIEEENNAIEKIFFDDIARLIEKENNAIDEDF